MKWLIVSLGCLFMASVSMAEVYEYTNEQGQKVYTDSPPSGKGEAVDIPPVMTYTPQVDPLALEPAAEPQDPSVGAYKSLRILSPQQEGTVRSNQGIVRFQYLSEPRLRRGDEAILYLDGEPQPAMDVEGLERGEHKAQVVIVDINGSERISSDVVTFFLHHQSRLLNK